MLNGHVSPGHDIGPDEDRLPIFISQANVHQSMSQSMVPVDVISHFYESESGDMEVEYERAFVHRPPGGLFHEPLDHSFEPIERRTAEQTRQTRTPFTQRQLYHEKTRLATFEGHWSEEYPVPARDLARNGLYYVGPGDKVKCVFCQKILHGWEPGDVVESEHARLYPNCPFVLGRCDQMNVPLNSLETLRQSYGISMRPKESQTKGMQDMSIRLKTFDHRWPSTVPVDPRLIAEAGLYYTGVRDKTLCFQCKKVIQGWEKGDDPWREHARLYPDCPYVLTVKGEEFVQSVASQQTSSSSNNAMTPQSQWKEQEGASQTLNSEGAQMQERRDRVQVPEASGICDEMSRLKIDDDLNSLAVLAFRECFEDVPVEEIRKMLMEIRLSKGFDYKLSTKDLEPLVTDK